MGNSNKLTLKVGGRVFAGWESVNIRTGIEQLAGTYELKITERWPSQPRDWTISPGEYCEVLVDDEPVISGYVDGVAVSYDAASHEIKVTGRDRAGDLVDCSAPSKAFSGQTFNKIATDLCKPFGIAVFDETLNGKRLTIKEKKAGKKGTPPKRTRVVGHIAKQACQNGETVFRTLEKLARNEGVLLVSDGEGGILITRAGLGGNCETVLKFGENILGGSLEHSHAALFSEITVKGQSAAALDDQFDVVRGGASGTVLRAPSKTTGNSAVGRYRPMIIVAEAQADAKRCQQRAQWEASNREAKARKVGITVQGWRENGPNGGSLWKVNKRVRVTCPWMRIDEWWLIAAVSFRLDEGGSVTDLSLVSDKAFDELPEIPDPATGVLRDKYRVTK